MFLDLVSGVFLAATLQTEDITVTSFKALLATMPPRRGEGAEETCRLNPSEAAAAFHLQKFQIKHLSGGF